MVSVLLKDVASLTSLNQYKSSARYLCQKTHQRRICAIAVNNNKTMSLFKMNKKNELRTNTQTHRSFEYAKGDVTLKFSLRTDEKKGLKDFMELLNKAVIDVQGEIERA